MDPGGQHSGGDVRGQPETVRRVLTVGDHQVGGDPARQLRQPDEQGPASRLSDDISQDQDPDMLRHAGAYRAYSTTRISRMIVTLIRPGYFSSFSMRLAMDLASSLAASSLTVSLLTRMRSSRPAWMA